MDRDENLVKDKHVDSLLCNEIGALLSKLLWSTGIIVIWNNVWYILRWCLLIGGVVFGTLSEVDCCVGIIIGELWRVLRLCVMLDCLRVFGSVGVVADGD